MSKLEPKVTPKIGLLPTGLHMYWLQYPRLKARGMAMYNQLVEKLSTIGEVYSPGLVDTDESAERAAEYFKKQEIDILLIFPFGYTTGAMITPTIRVIDAPIRLINAHVDSSYDYKTADTEEYLFHEGPCCIPEYSGAMVSQGKKFKVITGYFAQESFWTEIYHCCLGAAAASAFVKCRFGVIGATYTNMCDMPTDEHRILKVTGRLLCRPEVEEVEEAYKAVTDEELEAMYAEFRELYRVDASVTNEHMRESAKIAVAFDKIIKKYKIDAFGFYWWGKKPYMTELRAQSALAVSRLAAMDIPGVTEGDIKTAMAMKILNYCGGGGMFMEFFSCDFDENFIMVGHDGPSNISVASDKPILQNLTIHHGKTGDGLGIDFDMRKGLCTILNLTQFGTDKPYKLIYTIGEVIPGDILNIGNPNCRVRLQKPIPDFFNDWCVQGPGHHSALGVGDFSKELEMFAEKMGFDCVRI